MERDKKKNRSDRYQSLFAELSYSNDMMSDFSEQEGLVGKSDPELKEKYLDCKDRLQVAFWRLVRSLTPRQQEVIRLYCDNLTQIEIAKKLKVNQSSVTKSLNGNCDYRNGKKIYGGAKKKLKRLAEKDPEVIEILREMTELGSSSDWGYGPF